MMLIVFPAVAQNCNYSLYGTIRDAGTQQPLPGATASLLTEGKIAITDKDGHFHFNRLCAGTYRVKISYLGFSDQEIAINLTKNQEIAINLDTDDKKLAEVLVVSSTTLLPLQTTSKLEGNALELTRGESLGEALKRLPGLNSIQTGPAISKPVIHGMHSNRVLIYNSGVRIEGQQWGSEHAPEIDPFLATEITVVKGAASVQYGPDALGGVILVNPDGLNFHRHFSGNINVVGASNNRQGSVSASVDGATRNEQFAWRLQSTVKKGGNSKTPDYYLNNTGLQELNGSLTLGYKKKRTEATLFMSSFNTTIGIFEGAHVGSLDDLNARIANGRPFNDGAFGYAIDAPKQQVAHHLLRLSGKRFLANNSSLSLNYSLQRNGRKEYDIRRGGRTGIAALDLVLTAQNLEAIYETSSANNVHTKYGINTAVIVNNNVPGTFVTPVIPNYNSFNPALFVIKRWGMQKFELEAGLRYDYKYLDAAGFNREQELYGGEHHFHTLSGSAGGFLRLGNSLNFRSNLGLAWRPPSINELYSNGLHHGAAAIEIGNRSLGSEKGLKWTNTLELSTDKLNMELSGYGNFVNDYIFLLPSGEFEESLRGAFPIFNYKQANATFIGADLFGNYKISATLDWTLKAAVVRANNNTNDSYLPLIPADKLDNSIRWSKAAKGKKFSYPFIEIQHVFVARQHRFDAPNEFAAPPDAYNLFNLSGGVNHRLGENNLGLSLSVFNIFNTSYKDYLNRFRYYAHETGRNIVLRLNYKF